LKVRRKTFHQDHPGIGSLFVHLIDFFTAQHAWASCANFVLPSVVWLADRAE
jgi:hypothetical protein